MSAAKWCCISPLGTLWPGYEAKAPPDSGKVASFPGSPVIPRPIARYV